MSSTHARHLYSLDVSWQGIQDLLLPTARGVPLRARLYLTLSPAPWKLASGWLSLAQTQSLPNCDQDPVLSSGEQSPFFNSSYHSRSWPTRKKRKKVWPQKQCEIQEVTSGVGKGVVKGILLKGHQLTTILITVDQTKCCLRVFPISKSKTPYISGVKMIFKGYGPAMGFLQRRGEIEEPRTELICMIKQVLEGEAIAL